MYILNVCLLLFIYLLKEKKMLNVFSSFSGFKADVLLEIVAASA
jgi:hypothetical protein